MIASNDLCNNQMITTERAHDTAEAMLARQGNRYVTHNVPIRTDKIAAVIIIHDRAHKMAPLQRL